MPQYHFIASIIFATILFHFTKSPEAAFFFFISGFALDADHLVDFWLYRKKITIDREIFQHFHGRFGRIYLFLHSFELVALIITLSFLNLQNMILFAALALGLIFHLALDFVSYDLHPLSYFLTYRIFRRFDIKCICRSAEI